jgi:hypothetical protein
MEPRRATSSKQRKDWEMAAIFELYGICERVVQKNQVFQTRTSA